MDHWKQTLALHGDPWPADTEWRRIRNLQGYLARYPGYLNTAPHGEREDMVAQANGRYLGLKDEQCKENAMNLVERKTLRTLAMKQENKWDVDTTLELLESMKAYVIRHEMPRVGSQIAEWMEVAASLENPRRMEPIKFAQSCRVKYTNIQRCMRRSKRGQVCAHVRQSVKDFLQLCRRYAKIAKARSQSQTTIHKIHSPQRATQSARSEDTLPTKKASTQRSRTAKKQAPPRKLIPVCRDQRCRSKTTATELRSTGELTTGRDTPIPNSRNRTRKLKQCNGRGDELSAAGVLPDMLVVV